MASVKASENQSTGLATLPSGLLFDTFKSSPEDDKDSDEESFHLPMLDCDEDLQLDKSISNATETEEDILNKFETSPTEAPAADSNVKSTQETSEHENSTNGNEDTEHIEDNVVDSKEQNDDAKEHHEDAAIENNEELENKTEVTEELSDEVPTENSDTANDEAIDEANDEANDEMSVVNNETLTDENPIVDNADNNEQNEAVPIEEGDNFDNDAGDSPSEIKDDITTVEDNLEDEVNAQNGDDKIDAGENEELNEVDTNHCLDNKVESSETTNEDAVNEDIVVSKTEKLEEEEQLESLLSQADSTSQTYTNENSNLDEEEASLKDLVDNINVKMDDIDDELGMNDDAMCGENESESKHPTEEVKDDPEAIEPILEDIKEDEAMETEGIHENVEAEEKEEGCTMDVEDTEEPMLVDDDEEPKQAENVVQKGLIEEKTTESGQDPENSGGLVEDEAVNENVSQGEAESCKDETEDTAEDTQTQLCSDPLAEEAPEAEQGTESCKAVDQDEMNEGIEDTEQDETENKEATETSDQDETIEGNEDTEQDETENKKATETSDQDEMIEGNEDTEQNETEDKATETVDQHEMIEPSEDTQEDETEVQKATETEEESDCGKTLDEDAEQITDLPKDPLAEESSENDQAAEICKDLDKEEGGECEDKNSTDVDKTEDAREASKVSSEADTVSEIKETTETPSAEDNPPRKTSDAETKEEESSDNLLDISVIRDVDEDNATAIAEQVADSQASEKSDNDELDQEDDKTDEVEDSSEPDHEADKDETMDFEEEDDTTNVCDSVVEDTCDSDAMKIDGGEESLDKERTDTPTSEEDLPLSQRLPTNKPDESKKQAGSDAEADLDTTLTPEADKPEVQPEVAPVIPTSTVPDTVTPTAEESTKEVASQKKRSLSPVQQNETPSKKIRLSEEKQLQDKQEATPKLDDAKEGQPSGNVKVLLSFQKFMQNKKIKDKLTRSDLEQFCIQKICEAIIHKTDVGELHQTVKKQEQLIENLRKDLQTLSKQARDLDIVNKKLMNELKTQNNGKKPIVPLKITRSVGLQVKLNMGAEPTRRKSTTTTATSSTPTKTASSPLVNRTRNVQTSVAGNSVVRTISQGQSPVRSPASQSTTTPILTKALSGTQQQAVQQRSSPLVTHSTPASPMKRGGPIRKSPGMAEAHKVLNNSSPLKQTPNKAPGPMKPSQPGVIDLTDEDDRVAAPKAGGAPKTVRGVPIVQKVNGGTPAKGVQAKNVVKVGQQATPPGRTVAGLPQSVRLTPNQVKNGIAIPVSTGSTTQLMYVVQPSSTANNNQKTLTLLNLPTQQLLTSGMNGSTVSMISSKSPGTVQVKQLATRKHPAPLPLPPVMPVNSTFKPVLPKPHLSIRKTDNGIILQWRMPYNLDLYESIASYQLFAYQETNAPPSTEMWRKVGDVKALALPMACTLTQFADKNKYYFAVRSVDVHKRIGAFSDPEEISL